VKREIKREEREIEGERERKRAIRIKREKE